MNDRMTPGSATPNAPKRGVRDALADYVEVRRQIDAGDATWVDLARFFTDDAVYIDPAWGRVEGIDAIRAFFVESMTGLEDWRFPIRFTAIEGDEVVTVWDQVLPGARDDGRPYRQTGVSLLHYAGEGRFDFEEDLLNMAHVLEDLAASGWRPGPGFASPPPTPDRDATRP
jgi:ketosteroid isomerase-like protein